MTHRISAVAAHHRDFAVPDLAVRGVALTELAYRFDRLKDAFDGTLRELAPGGVGRQLAVQLERTRCDEIAPFTLCAEAIILQVREYHVRETVINLSGVHFVRTQTSH